MAVPELPRPAWSGAVLRAVRTRCREREASVPFDTVVEQLLCLDPVADVLLDTKMNSMSRAPVSPDRETSAAMGAQGARDGA